MNKIEQIAVAVGTDEEAAKLITTLNMVFDELFGEEESGWAEDEVEAMGMSFGYPTKNKAHLRFNYQSGLEFEVINYVEGGNWLAERFGTINKNGPMISHIGLHCPESEIIRIKKRFEDNGIDVAQEVFTVSHTNPNIKDKRRYHYVVFDTKNIIGFDLKLISRIMIE